ncbi:hypothetical protein ATK17_3917 [Branchiibius hedensis]|uniref:Uncharacterized protein n=1 Tax=Branchiibius hedensis TaxID=672460 RepID=A0A2Y9BQ10_9MICO|nr:hypothetical protein ATK17_3917 [Branchiibius hedensis]SSA59102.1 hypothetical protein SAMN04489750_3917 [Branchiibius hedensis]
MSVVAAQAIPPMETRSVDVSAWHRLTVRAVGCELPWTAESARVIVQVLNLCVSPATVLVWGGFYDPVDLQPGE